MQIVANILLVILIPLTILTGLSLRELQRVHGPDTMGPAFVLFVAGVIRWILAAIMLGLIIGCGRFDGMTTERAVQVLLIYGCFALVDCAAGIAIHASAPSDSATTPNLQLIGQVIGFGLPVLTLLLLLVRLNASAAGSSPTFACFFALLVIAVPTIAGYTRVAGRTTSERQRRTRAYWDEQQRLTVKGKADLAALPGDAPLAKILPYLVDEWPSDVRGDAFVKLEHRTGVFDELRAMLNTGGGDRDLSLAYMCQLSQDVPADLAAPVRDALIAQANDWKLRATAAEAPGIDEAQAKTFSRGCEQASSLSYRFREAGVDYTPVADAWQAATNAAPQSSAYIQSAQNTIMFWRHHLEDAAKTTKPPLQPAK